MQNRKETSGDQVYSLRLPSYRRIEGTIFYQFQLYDAIRSRQFWAEFRYKQLEEIRKRLARLQSIVKLPDFPKKSTFTFWKKTNENPQLIERRRQQLEQYFMALVNNPFTRGTPEVKEFIGRIRRDDFRNLERAKSARGARLPPQPKRVLSLNDAEQCLRRHNGVVEVIRRI